MSGAVEPPGTPATLLVEGERYDFQSWRVGAPTPDKFWGRVPGEDLRDHQNARCEVVIDGTAIRAVVVRVRVAGAPGVMGATRNDSFVTLQLMEAVDR